MRPDPHRETAPRHDFAAGLQRLRREPEYILSILESRNIAGSIPASRNDGAYGVFDLMVRHGVSRLIPRIIVDKTGDGSIVISNRRVAGAVERGGLEIRWSACVPVGSNPTPSAFFCPNEV